MISKGIITQRANEERLPAPTIERDYVQAQICADIGAISDANLVFKGAPCSASATSPPIATLPTSIPLPSTAPTASGATGTYRRKASIGLSGP